MKRLLILFLVCNNILASYAQDLENQKSIDVQDNEIALILTKSERYCLDSGKHLINEEAKIIIFNISNSLKLEEFDVLDSNAKSLLCNVTIEYMLVSKNIFNISDLLEWKHDIQSYKKTLFTQSIRRTIREVVLTMDKQNLDMQKSNNKEKIFREVQKSLSGYLESMSFEISFK